MIEQALLDYGIVGILLFSMMSAIVYLTKRDESRDKYMRAVVENNTVALTRFIDKTRRCEKNG